LLQTKTNANNHLPPPQFCWGGKVVSLATSSALNPFRAAAVCHPAMVEPKDAAAIKVPFIMLASGEEPADKVKEFENKLEGPKHVEIFEDQVRKIHDQINPLFFDQTTWPELLELSRLPRRNQASSSKIGRSLTYLSSTY